jgi:hypothetical protein
MSPSDRGNHDQASDQERRTQTLDDRLYAVGSLLALDGKPYREARPECHRVRVGEIRCHGLLCGLAVLTSEFLLVCLELVISN